MLLISLVSNGQELFEEINDQFVQQIESTYQKGVNFLAKTQNDQGSWDDSSYGSQPGVIGMSILAFLARGDDPEFGPHRKSITKALNYLLKLQDQKTGYIGSSMYNHGFATLALAEIYGRTNIQGIGPALEKATRLIITSQKNNPKGAWRYSPESTDADTTVSGAQMLALFAARNAGIFVPNEAIEKGKAFFLSCQDSNGGFGYTGSTGANLPRSSIGCLILSLAKSTDSKAYQKSVDFLNQNASFGDQGHKFYSLYYTSQAIFRANQNLWVSWNFQNFKQLKSSQTQEGGWNGNYGTTFSTSAALLSLALNYRYLPIYER
ncbi:MAG: terpene cyclase/mutase family protein [Opitutae bacterium]|nr:terpene cyclase/mutase family protein [Opitutae bacterium]